MVDTAVCLASTGVRAVVHGFLREETTLNYMFGGRTYRVRTCKLHTELTGNTTPLGTQLFCVFSIGLTSILFVGRASFLRVYWLHQINTNRTTSNCPPFSCVSLHLPSTCALAASDQHGNNKQLFLLSKPNPSYQATGRHRTLTTAAAGRPWASAAPRGGSTGCSRPPWRGGTPRCARCGTPGS